jgi:hypothetical protein
MHDDCLKRERERHGKKDMMKMQKEIQTNQCNKWGIGTSKELMFRLPQNCE